MHNKVMEIVFEHALFFSVQNFAHMSWMETWF